MRSETITGTSLELVLPFARIMRIFFPEESRKVEPVKGMESRADKRQDRPSIYMLRRVGNRIEINFNFRPGIEVDFYI